MAASVSVCHSATDVTARVPVGCCPTASYYASKSVKFTPPSEGFISSGARRLHNRLLGPQSPRFAPYVSMDTRAGKSSPSVTDSPLAESTKKMSAAPLHLTYLGVNSWLWDVIGMKILVDPVLVGKLDFGVPWLYETSRKELKDFKLQDLPVLDCLLITQGLDDHCHKKTLTPLSQMMPGLPVIASPNAEAHFKKFSFRDVTYLEPGSSTILRAPNGSKVTVRATAGPVLGPPWQGPENGYFLEVEEPKFVVYYEPHCVFQNANLEQEHADVVVTPVVEQFLPGLTLVHGQETAVKLVELLKPRYVVPFNNGDHDAQGVLSRIISQKGTLPNFQVMLSRTLPGVEVLEPRVGYPLELDIHAMVVANTE